MMKTHPINYPSVHNTTIMDDDHAASEYVHSFGSICGTVPYDKVIIAIVAFVKSVESNDMWGSRPIMKKVIDKIEEWNVMRSNTLSMMGIYTNRVDKRLFDLDQINQLSQCGSYSYAIKTLYTFSATNRMKFVFE
jgi:hypothetical protein